MLNDLYTPRGENLTGTPWTVYPRPQMKRDSYINLNGEWEFSVQDTQPEQYEKKILVPFCPESLLSGVKEHYAEGSYLWYRRSFTLPEGFNRGRILLHIGAAVLKNAQTIINDDGTTSFIPNENIFLVAFFAAIFVWFVLIPLFRKNQKQ